MFLLRPELKENFDRRIALGMLVIVAGAALLTASVIGGYQSSNQRQSLAVTQASSGSTLTGSISGKMKWSRMPSV